MLRPGWIDRAGRLALLATGALGLMACGALGGAGSAPATGAAADPAAPAPEVQARYASIVARLEKDDATAVADLQAFSAEHPDLAGPLLNLGMLHARAGNDGAALELYARAARVCTHCAPVWNEIGILHRQQGRFADAEQAYRRAIELEPGYQLAYLNLAMLYELYIPRPDLALQNYQQYLDLGGASAEGREVEKWLVDLRRRADAEPKTARAEGAT